MVLPDGENFLNSHIPEIKEPVRLEKFSGFSVSVHSDIGSRRTQEDRYIVVPSLGKNGHNISFFGVFDGTVGDFASSTIQDSIVRHLTSSKEWEELLDELEKGGENVPKLASKAIFKMYKSADEELIEQCAKLSNDYASSTSVTALFVGNYIVISHLGDSRASICYTNKGKMVAKFLTVDHKPNNPEERQRILASGGTVEFLCNHSNNPFIRGGDFTARKARGDQPMQLQYSRAFGGKDLKMYGLSNVPEIFIFERKPHHKCLLLASDGLWDVKDSHEAFSTLFYARDLGENPTQYLIESVIADQKSRARNSDNITVLAIFLD